MVWCCLSPVLPGTAQLPPGSVLPRALTAAAVQHGHRSQTGHCPFTERGADRPSGLCLCRLGSQGSSCTSWQHQGRLPGPTPDIPQQPRVGPTQVQVDGVTAEPAESGPVLFLRSCSAALQTTAATQALQLTHAQESADL